MPGTERWNARRAEAVEARDWGDEVVVYDADAATTSLLSAPAGSVFALLQTMDRPVTVEELAHHMFGPSDDCSAERSALEAVLADLERIGLCTRVVA